MADRLVQATIPYHDVSGLVLAGGQGRRMQDPSRPTVEKGLIKLHGKPLVAWAVAGLPSGLAQVYISANRQQAAYSQYGTIVSDHPDEGHDAGPLAGIASVLRQIRTEWLLVVPVDVPFAPHDWWRPLFQASASTPATVFYVQAGRAQPLFMLIHQRSLPALQAYLRAGGRQVMAWVQQHGQAISVQAHDDQAFFNVNTPANLDSLKNRYAKHSASS